MSMFTINGNLVNVFNGGDRVDKSTGEVQAGKDRVQILGEIPQPSGEIRFDLVTLSCEDRRLYEPLKGKRVTVPFGMFSPSKGSVIYFIPKGAKPELADA